MFLNRIALATAGKMPPGCLKLRPLSLKGKDFPFATERVLDGEFVAPMQLTHGLPNSISHAPPNQRGLFGGAPNPHAVLFSKRSAHIHS